MSMNQSMIPILDKGYIRLIDKMGSDLSVVNAARASFQAESHAFEDRDERLLKFLIREGHWSPFRHAFMTFEVKAPLMVARQWYKHAIASNHEEWSIAWNEASRRYVTMEPEFYIPSKWRSAPEDKKQGSGAPVLGEQVEWADSALLEVIEQGYRFYYQAMESGICAEQARMFLPAYGMYVNWRWSASLQSVMHFLYQRLADDAQWEIREYAKGVHVLAGSCFPISISTLSVGGK